MDRGNFLWKSSVILAVLRNIHFIPLGESFSMGPQEGVVLFTGGGGSRNNLKGEASVLIVFA